MNNTVTGETKTNISMRQCHSKFMLDNLVRWHHADNTRPGVAYTDQMSTLPITLHGLPLDSKITDKLHLPECDGSLKCICKHPETLDNEDIKQVLFKPQDNEEKLYNKFSGLMTWGRLQLWRKTPGKSKSTSSTFFSFGYCKTCNFSRVLYFANFWSDTYLQKFKFMMQDVSSCNLFMWKDSARSLISQVLKFTNINKNKVRNTLQSMISYSWVVPLYGIGAAELVKGAFTMNSTSCQTGITTKKALK